ncbi:MAG TPA: polyhydroxyalkanoate granule-associated phasin [Burkholderiaceae bacterium]|jgi:hypothetical protein|nr:polyhydroxyalkanoate granule-associated phasin [Burkholderiaceae bacterium]
MNSPAIRPSAAAAPLLAWADIAWKSFEIAAASGQVIPIRLARMAASGPNPTAEDRREFHRMGAEKVAAFSKSGAALAFESAPWFTRVALQSLESTAAFWMSCMRMPYAAWLPGHTAHRPHPLGSRAGRARYSRAVTNAIDSALAPVHATVTANARRLSGRKK